VRDRRLFKFGKHDDELLNSSKNDIMIIESIIGLCGVISITGIWIALVQLHRDKELLSKHDTGV